MLKSGQATFRPLNFTAMTCKEISHNETRAKLLHHKDIPPKADEDFLLFATPNRRSP